MPTGQNAKLWLVWIFYYGWHFVRPNFWLAFCPERLNMFWPFVLIIKCRHALSIKDPGLWIQCQWGWFDEFR